MKSSLLFLFAGLLEIGGGYLVWIWLREHRALWIGTVGFACLALYGVIPVFQSPSNPFGRVYAAYGAVFIVLSVFWGWWIDGKAPDLQDGVGAAICILGALVMMWSRS